MNPIVIVPIVEGHGESLALPKLLYRIASEASTRLRVNSPIRVKSSSFRREDGYFRRHVELAANKAKQVCGCVLILLDCEDECPGVEGPVLATKARAVRADVDFLVCLAHREYESWFLASARSLRGLRGLPEDLEPPEHPESIRDAKGWLSMRMTERYHPDVQREFSSRLNIESASTNASFRRLVRKVRALLD